MATAIGFDPGTWNSLNAAPFTVGGIYSYQGQLYQFVQVVTAAGADGVVFIRSGASKGIVLGANRGGVAGAVAGVGVGAITINQYGFIMVFGTHSNVLGVATVTAGRRQMASGTNDSGTDVGANAYSPSFGIALTGLTGARYQVDVRCLGS